jgi:hypothetical protein
MKIGGEMNEMHEFETLEERINPGHYSTAQK